MKTAKCATHIKLKNVRLATDLSEASMHAARYAISLATQNGGKLYAAHVISLDAFVLAHPEAIDRILKEGTDYAECALDELLAPASRQKLPCEALVGVGDITNVLRGFVEKYEADLVVVGTSTRAGLGKVFLGSVAEEIIRDAPCPVLTVGANAAGMMAQDIESILCAIDFSQESLHASEYAFFPQEHKAHLVLLHVVEGSMDEPPSHAVQLLSQALRELISLQAELFYKPEIVVTGGPVAGRILELAAKRSGTSNCYGSSGSRGFCFASQPFCFDCPRGDLTLAVSGSYDRHGERYPPVTDFGSDHRGLR